MVAQKLVMLKIETSYGKFLAKKLPQKKSKRCMLTVRLHEIQIFIKTGRRLQLVVSRSKEVFFKTGNR